MSVWVIGTGVSHDTLFWSSLCSTLHSVPWFISPPYMEETDSLKIRSTSYMLIFGNLITSEWCIGRCQFQCHVQRERQYSWPPPSVPTTGKFRRWVCQIFLLIHYIRGLTKLQSTKQMEDVWVNPNYNIPPLETMLLLPAAIKHNRTAPWHQLTSEPANRPVPKYVEDPGYIGKGSSMASMGFQ